MWSHKECLDLKILSQRLQGTDIPCKWLDSMCLFMSVSCPSLPQTLQILACRCRFPTWTMLSLVSIIDLTVSSSSCKFADITEVFGKASALFPVLFESCVTSFSVCSGLEIASMWYVFSLSLCCSSPFAPSWSFEPFDRHWLRHSKESLQWLTGRQTSSLSCI